MTNLRKVLGKNHGDRTHKYGKDGLKVAVQVMRIWKEDLREPFRTKKTLL